jgi:putative peptidoglycan lipid II flippase
MGQGRTALLLLPIAFASRAAAFAVPLVVARWFGVGPVTDAWFWALSFPTFTLVLAGTAIATSATPVIARVAAEDPRRLPGMVGGLVGWAALAGGLAALGIALAAPWLISTLTRFEGQSADLALRYVWQLTPFLLLTAAGAALRAACEVAGHFSAVAFTPLGRAAVVIGSTALLLEPLGPAALPWGLVLGEAAQVLWWAGLLRRGGLPLRPSLALDPAVLDVARDMAPILGGEVLVALNLVVDKGFAASLPTGAVATLEYADRARVIPQTLLESTLLMVSFSTWSRLRAAGHTDQARAAIDQSLRWTLLLGAPVVAGMFIGREPLIRLLYLRGAFTEADAIATAQALGCFLPGVLPQLLGILAVKAHILERNLRLVIGLGVVSLLCNSAGNALLIGPLGIQGLALSTTLTMFIVPGLYLARLRPILRGQAGPWARDLLIAACSAAIAVAIELSGHRPTHLSDLLLWLAALPCLALLVFGLRLSGFSR